MNIQIKINKSLRHRNKFVGSLVLIYAMIDNILRFNQQTFMPPATKAKPQDQTTHRKLLVIVKHIDQSILNDLKKSQNQQLPSKKHELSEWYRIVRSWSLHYWLNEHFYDCIKQKAKIMNSQCGFFERIKRNWPKVLPAYNKRKIGSDRIRNGFVYFFFF